MAEPSEFDRTPVYDTPADVQTVQSLKKGETPPERPER